MHLIADDVPVAVCGSCKTSYGVEQWRRLPMVGIQEGVYGTPRLEMRNCSCMSTLSVEVDEEPK